MSSSESSGDKKFTVKDARRFDEAGNDRTSSSRTTSEPSSTPSQATNAAAPAINFSSFLMSFATQALMQMGVIPPPDGVALQPDIGAAKQSIDIIEMLEVKTKGNLDADETKLIKEALYSLRLSFVQASKK